MVNQGGPRRRKRNTQEKGPDGPQAYGRTNGNTQWALIFAPVYNAERDDEHIRKKSKMILDVLWMTLLAPGRMR